MPPRLTYLEIPTTDVTRSAAFYQHVLGWKIEWRAPDDARLAHEPAQLIGRFRRDRAASADTGMLAYFYVEDLAAAIARVPEHGGTVTSPPALEGDTTIARVRDPAGNHIGLWQFA